jgi:hypothetical protein
MRTGQAIARHDACSCPGGDCSAAVKRFSRVTPPDLQTLAPSWAFVVQLRQGTSFDSHALCGRIEHVVSGRSSLFGSLEQARAFMELVIESSADSAGNAP